MFPTEVSAEKEAVQPIIGALLRTLSQIPTADENDGRSNLLRERFFPPSQEVGPRRYLDFETDFLAPFVPTFVPQAAPAPATKNKARRGQNAKSIHRESSKQMCRHLARRTLVAFDVGNKGINSSSVGLIITPAYMQMIRMSLVEMGTPTAHLELSRTKLLPLVTLEAFNRMVREPSYLSYLGPLLFPKQAASAEPNTAEPDTKVPLGLHYLWEILHSDDKSLGILFFGESEGDQGACFVGEGQADVALDMTIGSGTHGIVYGHAGRFSMFVVKASVVGETRYIETEAKALTAFSHGGSRCKYLPELKCLGKVRYTIRDLPLEVPALMLTPRGIPLSQNQKIDSSSVGLVWSNIREALSFAHDKGVFHLDVCPRNIIRHGDSFLLFDWGTAGFAKQKVLGFRGSLPYACKAVHSRKNTVKW
jgi:hypothetical protein